MKKKVQGEWKKKTWFASFSCCDCGRSSLVEWSSCSNGSTKQSWKALIASTVGHTSDTSMFESDFQKSNTWLWF